MGVFANHESEKLALKNNYCKQLLKRRNRELRNSRTTE